MFFKADTTREQNYSTIPRMPFKSLDIPTSIEKKKKQTVESLSLYTFFARLKHDGWSNFAPTAAILVSSLKKTFEIV